MVESIDGNDRSIPELPSVGTPRTGPVSDHDLPSLTQLKYLIAVAEDLHFTRAAARLGISQPRLSQQIRKLERDVGVELFRRTKRHVELTDAGRQLLEFATDAIGTVRRGVEASRLASAGRAGTLNIGYVSAALLTCLPGHVEAVHLRHPAMHFRFEQMTTNDQTTALLAGKLNVGYIRLGMHHGLETQILAHERLEVVLRRDDPLATSGDFSVEMLDHADYVYPDPIATPELFSRAEMLFASSGSAPRKVMMGQTSAIRIALVQAGLGFTVVHSLSYAPTVRSSDRLVFRPLREADAGQPLSIAWRADSPPIVDLYLKEALAEQRWSERR